ncbi:DEAD/DEAH box helicase [Photobacterium toruni]|uniref:DEAD/DEAH box helicase n=1 Tax=Photobacterium toruni TaxID=1935446 RepID=UPI002110C33C|nr:DEAD/DEAH box helicase [Photobacterium toruni]
MHDYKFLPTDTNTYFGYDQSGYTNLIVEYGSSSDCPFIVVAKNDQEALHLITDLNFFLSGSSIHYFPDLEVLAYDQEMPSSALVSKRGRIFHALMSGKKIDIIVTTANALIRKNAGIEHWLDSVITLSVGQKFNFDEIKYQLNNINYKEILLIDDFGQYSFRNNIFDIYPIGESSAYRIIIAEDGKISELKYLNTSTQLSQRSLIQSITVMPVYEFPFNSNVIPKFRTQWRQRFKNLDHVTSAQQYKDVTNGIIPHSACFYMPFFCNTLLSLFDLIPKNATFFFNDESLNSINKLVETVSFRYLDMLDINNGFILKPSELWLTETTLFEKLTQHNVNVFSEVNNKNLNARNITINGISRFPTIAATIKSLQKWFENVENVLFVISSDVRDESLRKLLSFMKVTFMSVNSWGDFCHKGGLCVTRGGLETGFYDHDNNRLVITENELYGMILFQPVSYNEELEKISIDSRYFSDLEVGDPIVHLKYGIGRFHGFEMVDVNSTQKTELIKISYQNDVVKFIPPQELDMVSRYSGIEKATAPFDEYHSKKWTKGLHKVVADIGTISGSLKDIYKNKQENWKGVPCDKPSFAYLKFCNEFPYPLTMDQSKAINDVIVDLTSEKVMDRLISGDVGYGKTEIAVRAAFIAAYTGYQVAIMVPTSILAIQHFETFKKRFEGSDLKVAFLSGKGDAAKDEISVLQGLSDGSIDIVIGTTRLLQKDVKIQALGLVVTDEEHRFGVKDKEKLGHFSIGMNVLSMTATPIPRSMSLSLHNIRDLSIIATPPAKRLSIRTYAVDKDNYCISEAINRELARNGQVFVVHNRVKTIEARAQEIANSYPSAIVRFAHGQMPDHEMDAIISEFFDGKIDILVASTIIEVGIDVPNANTIIIDDANNMGLAQLHQLRGRVGRSHYQAYAYLIRSTSITEDGRLRLLAMEKVNGLGKGLELAKYDMEIRGAGQLLGDSQSGSMINVGYDLYMKLLKWNLKLIDDESYKKSALLASGYKGKKFEDSLTRIVTEIKVGVPSEYIVDIANRFSVYHQILNADINELESIKIELKDIYGPIPESVEVLILIAEYSRKLADVDIQTISITKAVSTIKMFSSEDVDISNRVMIGLRTMGYESELSSEITHNLQDKKQVKAQYNAESSTKKIKLFATCTNVAELSFILEDLYESALKSNHDAIRDRISS